MTVINSLHSTQEGVAAATTVTTAATTITAAAETRVPTVPAATAKKR